MSCNKAFHGFTILLTIFPIFVFCRYLFSVYLLVLLLLIHSLYSVYQLIFHIKYLMKNLRLSSSLVLFSIVTILIQGLLLKFQSNYFIDNHTSFYFLLLYRGETFRSLLVARYFLLVARSFLLVARYFLLVARQEILKDCFFSQSKQKVLHINLHKKFNL